MSNASTNTVQKSLPGARAIRQVLVVMRTDHTQTFNNIYATTNFLIIPEPATAGLIGLGGLLLLHRRRCG